MAKSPIHRPLALLRWVFLGLALLAAGWVAHLYLEGRPEPEEPPRRADGAGEGAAGSEVVIAGEGFEYEATEGGETLFSIRAARMTSDRQDRYGLEQVELTMDREGDAGYEIVSRTATYELDSRDASLRGQVVLHGPDGLQLRGEGFDLRQMGRVLVSTEAPSQFVLPGGLQGRAKAVRLNLHREHVVLAGNVTVASPPGTEPPLRMRAARMAFNRAEGALRAEGDVTLRRGGDELRCRRLSAEMTAGGGIRFVHCNFNVSGRLEQGDSSDRQSTVDFQSRSLAVLYEESGREARQIELEGSVASPAVLVMDDGTGRRRTVRSPVITAQLAGGVVESVQTLSAAVLEESLARRQAAPLRRLCGNGLSGSFTAAGEIERLVLEGSVSFQEDGLSARGARLVAAGERQIELSGRPAHLISAKGEVAAPQIVYSRTDRTVRASGGVEATAQERAGVDLAVAGNGNLPVRVTARQAEWTERPDRAVFDGEVRAWQGENFLLADHLETSGAGDRLEASGSVKTVWKPPPGGEPRAPVEVNAGLLDYQRGDAKLHYSEGVRAHESGRTMRCRDMDLLLGDGNRIDSLFCQGEVMVDDPRQGKVIRGGEANYQPAARNVLFSGEPVVLRDRDGTEIRGRRLLYDLDSGKTQVLSEPRTERPETEPPPTGGPESGGPETEPAGDLEDAATSSGG